MKLLLRNLFLIAAPLLVFSMPWSIVLATLISLVLYLGVPYLQRRDENISRRASATDFAATVEVLTLCLSAGLAIPDSLKQACAPRKTLCQKQLAQVMDIYDLGQDLPTALVELDRLDERWTLLSRIIRVSYVSGAPALESLDSFLTLLLEDAQSAVTIRIRAVSVKCVLPLAICFLPAFFVLTVVPLVAQFVEHLHW